MTPSLSVILPCYRAEPLARRSVAELCAHFAALEPGTWEVVVVDDGGGDFGPEWDGDGPVRVVRLPRNRGKGAAVTAGMAAARGRARVFTDVDLPYDPELIRLAAEYVLNRGFHVVVGDRTLPSSSYREELGAGRKIASWLGATFIGRLVTGGFFDTQCGLKAVRGDVAGELFPLLRIDRFAFDVELIYVSLLHRLDIKRIPVRLRRNEQSSVRILRDCTRAAFDVLRIKYHQLRGEYTSRALHRLVDDEFRAVHATVLAPPAPAEPLTAFTPAEPLVHA
ncbi:MAG TPA: glycosyltransferase [Longimicrobium sp.]|nr:glycosyltransferase [Longimicrobium sp.]